jgi:hypothetical protein
MKARNKRIVKKSGFKKKKVIVPRKKLRKRGGSCRTADYDFLSVRTQRRRTGRTIRKSRRLGKNPEPMHAVK